MSDPAVIQLAQRLRHDTSSSGSSDENDSKLRSQQQQKMKRKRQQSSTKNANSDSDSLPSSNKSRNVRQRRSKRSGSSSSSSSDSDDNMDYVRMRRQNHHRYTIAQSETINDPSLSEQTPKQTNEQTEETTSSSTTITPTHHPSNNNNNNAVMTDTRHGRKRHDSESSSSSDSDDDKNEARRRSSKRALSSSPVESSRPAQQDTPEKHDMNHREESHRSRHKNDRRYGDDDGYRREERSRRRRHDSPSPSPPPMRGNHHRRTSEREEDKSSRSGEHDHHHPISYYHIRGQDDDRRSSRRRSPPPSPRDDHYGDRRSLYNRYDDHRGDGRSRRPMMDRREMERERQRRERRERREGYSPSSSRYSSLYSPSSDRRRSRREEGSKPEALISKLRAGGVYIPPFKLRKLQKQVTDKKTIEFQRLNWDALRKSINGIINKVNINNIVHVVVELFGENLVRGRGLLARAIMKAQAASPSFTHVYASLLAIVNTKIPEIGELVLKRLVATFRKAYQRNDKVNCIAFCKFIAHLVNHQVAHEVLAGQFLGLLLEKPTDDSVELAVSFTKECGQAMSAVAPKIIHAVFERFRSILHEGQIDKRVQYIIESLFEVRRKKFENFPAILTELDLVEEDDRITHEIELDEEFDTEDQLDQFHMDDNFEINEQKYRDIKIEILGFDPNANESDDEGDLDEEEAVPKAEIVENMTEEEVQNFKRTIYGIIMSSLNFEESAHKLLRSGLLRNHEMEFCSMLIECCGQERTFVKYYGLLGQRFCQIARIYQEKFEECFELQYSMVHRLDSVKMRNIAQFYAFLMYNDALPWGFLTYVKINPTDTTPASRIFIMIIFQELSEQLGTAKLVAKLREDVMKPYVQGLFPTDNPKNTRFAINYWISIGLGDLSVDLKEHLKTAPRIISKDSDSDSSDSDSSSSSSDSD